MEAFAEAERIKELEAKVEALQKFKQWTHGYLDSKGVPHHPPGVHGPEGCRIGDRMDWVWSELNTLANRVADQEALVRECVVMVPWLAGWAKVWHRNSGGYTSSDVVMGLGRLERLLKSLNEIKDEPSSKTPLPSSQNSGGDQGQQAQAWVEVYRTCEKLGLLNYFGTLGASGKERVCEFVTHLADQVHNLKLALWEAIRETDTHNKEYHHTTPKETIAKWKGLAGGL